MGKILVWDRSGFVLWSKRLEQGTFGLPSRPEARNLGLDAEQRLQLRLKESKPVFDLFGQWLQIEYAKVTPASTIGKAIYYLLQRQKKFLAC